MPSTVYLSPDQRAVIAGAMQIRLAGLPRDDAVMPETVLHTPAAGRGRCPDCDAAIPPGRLRCAACQRLIEAILWR